MDERAAQVSHALGLDLGGLVLDGRYQIGRRLGAGGMAAVYEGRRVGLERRVAIKILRPELAENESNVRRFLREAKAASAISHPNVVSIEDVGGASRPVYFVMEFLDGVDLRHELRRLGRFDWPRTHDLAQQVVSALSAAHAVGIVHRDVKPANCFLVRETDAASASRCSTSASPRCSRTRRSTPPTSPRPTASSAPSRTWPRSRRAAAWSTRAPTSTPWARCSRDARGTVPFYNLLGHDRRLLGEALVPLRMHRPDLSPELDAVVMTCPGSDPDARFRRAWTPWARRWAAAIATTRSWHREGALAQRPGEAGDESDRASLRRRR
ncbi:MAG: serine/threonine-protein kinase [Nannocystaceae bacterium]